MSRINTGRKAQMQRDSVSKRLQFESLERRLLLSTVVVNTTADQVDNSNSTVVSLRDAFDLANVSTSPTTITFDPTVFATPQTITLDGTVLDLDNNAEATTVIGPAAGLTLDGNSTTRVLIFTNGTTASLSNLTITGGYVDGVLLANNYLGAGVDGDGASVSLTNITVFGNRALGVGRVLSDGAGIANHSDSTMTLTNVTVFGNTCTGPGGGIGNEGTMSLNNVTVADNTASNGGGIDNRGTLTLSNSIVAGNHVTSGGNGPDIDSNVTSLGYNVIGEVDGSSGTVSTDHVGTIAIPLNADLGSLANNGGPTDTLLPLAGSPAINGGSNALIPAGITTDQTGAARIQGNTVDVGAVETSTGPTAPAETIGGLDHTFGTGGLARHDVGFTNTQGLATDGSQSVLTGTIGTFPTESFGLTRYNADGSLDTSFGSHGTVTTSFSGTDDVPAAVTVLSSGTILVGGTATTYSNGIVTGSEFAIAEYNADGSLDTNFGGTGEVLVSLSNTAGVLSNDLLRALQASSNGTIYLGGSSDAAGKGNTDFAIAAINANGSVDSGFGTAGKTFLDFSGGDDIINGLALQSNGDLVAVGSTTSKGITEIAMTRLLPDGAIDKRFGSKGQVIANGRGIYDSASSVVIQPNGAIVVAGLSATGSGSSLSSDFLVQRYTSTGRIDRTFGNGMVITSFGQPSAITQVKLQANGEIIASGKTTANLTDVVSDDSDLALARYTTRGVLDSTFNKTGTTIIDLNQDATTPASQIAPFMNQHLQPLESSSDATKLNEYGQMAQGVVAVTTKGEVSDAGNVGNITVEAQILTMGLNLLTTVLSALPTAVLGGVKGTASISVEELGTTQAITSVTLKIQFATDSYGDGATTVDSLIERINLKQLQSHLYKVSFTYPTVSISSGFYLVATVTELPTVTDLDLSNNTAPSNSPVTVGPPTIALAGSSLLATSVFTPGKSANIQIDLINNGNIVAKGKISVQLFLSSDQTTADGTQIVSEPLVIALSAAKSHVYKLKFTLPTIVSAGRFNFLAIVDPTDSLGSNDLTKSLVVDPTVVAVI